MVEELTVLDWILCGGVALLALTGLFRGLSGELGSLAGFAAAFAAGFCLHGAAVGCAEAFGFTARGMGIPATAVIDFIFALVAFGLARWVVSRFVSFCLGRVANAALGFAGGLFKGVMVVGLLAGVGYLQPGTYSEGYFTAYSTVIRTVATWADSYVPGGVGAR